MVAFMLNRPRKKSARLNLDGAAFKCLCANDDRLSAFNVAGDFRKTQAAFEANFSFAVELDFGVNQH